MKKYISRLAILSSCALVLASCDDNSWNDDLKGFEANSGQDNVQSLNLTLTAADYKLLSTNTTNKQLAGDEKAGALAAVATQCYLTDVITAEDYIPALLSDVKFRYFTLDNGSSVNVTYNYGENIPEQVELMAVAKKYVVSDEDYQAVWESETDYTAAFAPSHTAAKSIPGILKAAFPDADTEDYVIVNYETSAVDPVFTSSEPETPGFPMSSVLGSLALNDVIDVNGVVVAISTQGPVVTDASGSVFAYLPSNNSDLKVGDQVVFEGTVSSYNYAFQMAKGSNFEVKGNQEVVYPTAKSWTGAEIDAFVAANTASGATPITPVYSKFTGKVAVSGNYLNIVLDGTTVQLSPYGASDEVKALLPDGATVELEGYVVALASKGKFFNTIITKVGTTAIKAPARVAASRAVTVASTNENAIYNFNGTNWVVAPNTVVLSHADYQAMGQKYDNLSEDGPATYLPTFLKTKYPYAQAQDIKYVVYYYYSGGAVTRAQQYVYNGNEWYEGNEIVEKTLQFVKNDGAWAYNPSVTVTLPAGKGIAISTLYYQTCVDWIKNNVPDGDKYVTSYGNNEYYCGTSAYQGNVDLRPSAAVTQYAEGYAGMTDEQIVALEKERFEKEVMPAALGILHPDMAPIAGIDVTLTLNFYYYDGTTHEATAVFKVVGKGKFEYVSCTWNE